jgi:hypothetical protein
MNYTQLLSFCYGAKIFFHRNQESKSDDTHWKVRMKWILAIVDAITDFLKVPSKFSVNIFEECTRRRCVIESWSILFQKQLDENLFEQPNNCSPCEIELSQLFPCADMFSHHLHQKIVLDRPFSSVFQRFKLTPHSKDIHKIASMSKSSLRAAVFVPDSRFETSVDWVLILMIPGEEFIVIGIQNKWSSTSHRFLSGPTLVQDVTYFYSLIQNRGWNHNQGVFVVLACASAPQYIELRTEFPFDCWSELPTVAFIGNSDRRLRNYLGPTTFNLIKSFYESSSYESNQARFVSAPMSDHEMENISLRQAELMATTHLQVCP